MGEVEVSLEVQVAFLVFLTSVKTEYYDIENTYTLR